MWHFSWFVIAILRNIHSHDYYTIYICTLVSRNAMKWCEMGNTINEHTYLPVFWFRGAGCNGSGDGSTGCDGTRFKTPKKKNIWAMISDFDTLFTHSCMVMCHLSSNWCTHIVMVVDKWYFHYSPVTARELARGDMSPVTIGFDKTPRKRTF